LVPQFLTTPMGWATLNPQHHLINPSEEGATQPETGQVSIETQAPNPLSTLIHIYSNDESPEPAHGSPVRVQEEEGPEKTSSPEPEVQDKEVSQKETGAEGGLNTRESDGHEAEATSEVTNLHKRKSTVLQSTSK
jgi:hypothetical protein